ncbi:hypothetical protein [Chondromyces apiculatus]|uniref:Uncharacterized protein n=1 Tax=Chondromyces apiculatus DSM 436 TaxID=1192034 RepID=A0A017T6K4_9BACT|nr:hypothetical protein [Chondromyces apiculatus]EYF04627.1 Hypothetical protein CAP_4303 [Chondromyces apiculatus DSM 436]
MATRTLVATKHLIVTIDPERALSTFTRLETPFATTEEMVQAVQSAFSLLKQSGGASCGMLLDLRRAPGRNDDPGFEARVTALFTKNRDAFLRFAVVVGTASGRLHVQRIGRQLHAPGDVFLVEAEALAFLRTGEMPTRGNRR